MFDSNAIRQDPNALQAFPGPRCPASAPWEIPHQSRLIAAASSGDLEAIGQILSASAGRLDLAHPLRLAAKHRHGEAVRLLVSRGASVSRAFSPDHIPVRRGKREQLVQFLASCHIDGQFILALPRPQGPRPKRSARRQRAGRSGKGTADLARARQATAKREAWAGRRDALIMRRVLKNHDGLLAEILAAASNDAVTAEGLERAVRVVLSGHGILDRKQRLSRAIASKLYGDGQVSATTGALSEEGV